MVLQLEPENEAAISELEELEAMKRKQGIKVNTAWDQPMFNNVPENQIRGITIDNSERCQYRRIALEFHRNANTAKSYSF